MKSGQEFLKAEEADIAEREPQALMTDETEIFRYVSMEVFLSMVERRENWLSHISKWDDPFEGYAFRGDDKDDELINVYGECSRRDLYRNYFGQSWTLCSSESDMRWRAYCPNRDGVRIKSTVGQLKRSLIVKSRDSALRATCFNRVFYFPRELLRKKLELLRKKQSPGVEMLFVKAEEFRDESEYRVVVDRVLVEKIGKAGAKFLGPEAGFLKYKLEAGGITGSLALFNEILVDPRMENLQFERLKSRIAHAGVTCRVLKSKVYDWN